jgi:hypothetical protein
MDASARATPPNDAEPWTIRGLLARHKRATAGMAAALAVMLTLLLIPVLASGGGTVLGDATTCSEWGSANQNQHAAYARLYVREHGPLRSGGTSSASIIAAVNAGCTRAYEEDVSDTATVVQAISGNF